MAPSKVRVRIYAHFNDPGRINFGQELFDFHWYAGAVQLMLACTYLQMPGDLTYQISHSTYEYISTDECTVYVYVYQIGA